MAVTLAEAKRNAQNAYDPFVIDEFRKESAILDSLIFDPAVNPSGGGATLTYGYRRLATQATAATRAINTEYDAQNVTTSQHSVNLAVMGGSFEIDRVLADVGPAASGAVALNIQQKVKATRAKFTDEVINGDVTLGDANGFDGLNAALTGSDTEMNPAVVTDWSALDQAGSLTALDTLDEFLGMLDGTPTVLVGNNKVLAKIRSIARRSGMYVRNPIDGLVGANGRPIVREEYGGIIFVDAGDKAGSSNKIIGTYAKYNKWTVTVAANSGNYKLTVDGQTTANIAYNANDAAIKAALELLPSVGEGGVVSITSKAIVFGRTVTMSVPTDDAAAASVATTAGTAGGTGLTDLYAYRVGLDGFHGVTTVGSPLIQTWLPNFQTAGAVKKGEVELGPIAVALKATKAAGVLRNIKVQ